ncbi:MAG TPA: porin family protein [Chitinophagaceae bacterium]|nr:porin family protein [Chitinophagaceae bacterium]
MTKISIAVMAIVLLAASLFTMQAQAQISYGAKAGIAITNFKADGESEKSKTGLVLGAFGRYDFSGQFAAQAELLYAQSGAKESAGSYNFSYLNVPLLARYTAWKGLYLATGPQLGFLLSAHTKENNGDKEDIKEYLKGTDISWVIGAGYELENGIGADIRFVPGLTDISDNNANIKNTAVQVTLSYKFGKKK